MKKDELLKRLVNGEEISLSTETKIAARIKCFVGGIPMHNIRLEYIGDDCIKNEIFEAFDDFLLFAEMNPDIVRICEVCKEFITNTIYADNEQECDYCSLACMVKGMNKNHGIGNWRQTNAFECIPTKPNYILKVSSDWLVDYDNGRDKAEVFYDLAGNELKCFEEDDDIEFNLYEEELEEDETLDFEKKLESEEMKLIFEESIKIEMENVETQDLFYDGEGACWRSYHLYRSLV